MVSDPGKDKVKEILAIGDRIIAAIAEGESEDTTDQLMALCWVLLSTCNRKLDYAEKILKFAHEAIEGRAEQVQSRLN